MKANIWRAARYALMAMNLIFPVRGICAKAVGRIVGTDTDPSGAVGIRASVSATDAASQVVQIAVTTSVGDFTVPDLGVATYDVQAEAKSFAPDRISGIHLDESRARSLGLKLVLTGLSQPAAVTAAAPLLNTMNGSLSGLVSKHER
jgi:hypothetical protein